MDSFAAVAFTTDEPDPSVLNRRPEKITASAWSLIPLASLNMIIGQALAEVAVTCCLSWAGVRILFHTWGQTDAAEATLIIKTLGFNTFIWSVVFNLLK
jgi:Ca2+-transporting ATPase